MARSDKVTAVVKLVEHFRAVDAILPTEYRGLTVGQLKQLRCGLNENATYAVAKNTLTYLAVREVSLNFLAEDLKDPAVIVFVSGEPTEAAKILRDFTKGGPALVLKSGAMDGARLSAEAIKKLVDLEFHEVLLAEATGVLKTKTGQATFIFNASPVKAVRAIDTLCKERSKAAWRDRPCLTPPPRLRETIQQSALVWTS